jgi:hypothetical protein
MTTNRQFSLALQALTELKTETSTPPPSGQPVPAAPNLNTVLAEMVPLPRQALFLGVASDGLPVLLNMHDPHPGPMLVAGDAGSGKTVFLQTILHSVAQTHSSDDVQVGVITAHPEEWESVEATSHSVGIFHTQENSAQDFMSSLAAWAHANTQARQSVLLLIDGLESIASLDFDALQNFRWLLLRGPTRRVWPIITLNAARREEVKSWLEIFRTRIFGHIEDELIAAKLGADTTSALNQLVAGIQFSLRENQNWLRFWLPSF